MHPVTRWLIRDSSYRRPRGVLRVWPLWERTAHFLWPVHRIPGSARHVLGVHFTRHRGSDVLLSDGTLIRSGEPVAEVHIDNPSVIQSLGQARGPERWTIVTVIKEELQGLASWISRPDFDRDVRAVFGVTVLSRAAARFGFDVRARRPSLGRRFDELFLKGLLIIYTPEGRDRLSQGKAPLDRPREIWMSRTELLRRYGPGAAFSTQWGSGSPAAAGDNRDGCPSERRAGDESKRDFPAASDTSAR